MKTIRFYALAAASGATVTLFVMLLTVRTTVTYAHGGDSTKIHACLVTASGSIRIVGANDSCRAGETPLDWNIQGPAGPTGSQGPQGPAGPPGGGDLVLILDDDFDTGAFFTGAWTASFTGNGAILFTNSPSTIRMDTSSSSGGDSATLRSNRAFSVNDGTLILKTRLGAYHDCCIYGDGQPRGLAAGTNRNNAIEFVSVTTMSIAARTVAGGVATQTVYNLGESVYNIHAYQIVARPTEVKFYIDGNLIATHTTNIPTVPLNVHFTTFDGGFGTTPIDIDGVSFEIVR